MTDRRMTKRFSSFAELTKPRITSFILMSAASDSCSARAWRLPGIGSRC